MNSADIPSASGNHAGILFPLDMFRPSMLAAALAEGLVAKARNVLDAKLVLTRHPEVSLVLARIEGSVVGDDEAAFWRENADLAMYASQALPRQCFMYFVADAPEKRQGFVVAQRGQVLAGDDAGPDTFPPDTPDEEWPVNRLCAQIQIHPQELADRFEGGPTVAMSLMEPSASEDQEALMALAGQPPEGAEGAEDDLGPLDGPPPQQASAPGGRPAPSPGGAGEQRERDALAERVIDGLRVVSDDLGVIVLPEAELGDTDVLTPFVVRKVEGDLPNGLPRDMTRALQGKRVDFAVRVEFLSEVFYDNAPLNKPQFEENGQAAELAGLSVRTLEVFAPRLGAGTLIRKERDGLFISRTPDQPIPDEVVRSLLTPA